MSSTEAIVERLRAGDRRVAARVISLIEDGDAVCGPLLAGLFAHTGRARVIGITGAPGAGKSTLVERLVRGWRERGRSVGVLAVDPSSPFTGGAILGDRIRMASLTHDRGVFIRSMAARGHLGGIAEATPAAIRVLDAMGMDIVLVETVGVGQSEVAIAAAADCTVLVTMPGGGDAVQTMKAGVMEIGDVFVVNKSDREGAVRVRREIGVMLRLQERTPRPPVLLTRADAGEGIDEVLAAIDEHLTAASESGELEDRRLRHLKREAIDLIGRQARRRALAALDDETVARLTDALGARRLDPATVAARALETIIDGSHGNGAAPT